MVTDREDVWFDSWKNPREDFTDVDTAGALGRTHSMGDTRSTSREKITGGMPTKDFEAWQKRLEDKLATQQNVARVRNSQLGRRLLFEHGGKEIDDWLATNPINRRAPMSQVVERAEAEEKPQNTIYQNLSPDAWKRGSPKLAGEPMEIAWQFLKGIGMDGLDEDGNYPERGKSLPQYAFRNESAPTGGFTNTPNKMNMSQWLNVYRQPKPPADPEAKARSLADRGFTPQAINRMNQENAAARAALNANRRLHQPKGG